ncbi:MAG: DegV family protein [Chloroflexota bacterium]
MKIAIVTDSTSDLPANLATERRITITPLHVLWDSESFLDGVDITPDAFYARLAYSPTLPKSSQPSAGEFAEKFRQAREKESADAVLCITISQALSGTYASAETARSLVDFPVTVIDSRTASIALGMTVLMAAEARDRGCSMDEMANIAAAAGKRSQMFFTPNSLEFLHRGGRIGGAQRWIGTALSIKPILYVKDGAVASLESVRSRKKALERTLAILQEHNTARPLRVGLAHSNPPELESFKQQVQEILKPDVFIVTTTTPVVGVHVGPETFGIGLLSG